MAMREQHEEGAGECGSTLMSSPMASVLFFCEAMMRGVYPPFFALSTSAPP